MSMHPFTALRQLFDRISPPGQTRASVPSDERQDGQVPDIRPASKQEMELERSNQAVQSVAASGPEPGSSRSAQVAQIMANYLGARAEEMLELLIEALSWDMTDEVAHVMQATREALSTEIASIRESTSATQRESARMGRELMRTGATLEGVQASLSDVGTALQRLEAALESEGQSAREREQEIREEIWWETLGDVMTTLDGLEAALDESRAIAQALIEVGRQIDDPTVRRWWRAMGEAIGTQRPLPSVPISDVEIWVRGLELTYRRLRDALERRGVTPIEALGMPFDPHVHEAVAVMDCPPEQDGIVLREEQHGYRAADRVIRLAQVVVGKAVLPAEEPSRPLREAEDMPASEVSDQPGEKIADE
ncbi:MAG: nucleotide exchange factor GrpE [Chloroflexota bacterium]|nr:MAG: nucleotide exchange factor GrpE [Chloroflexota bacterium]